MYDVCTYDVTLRRIRVTRVAVKKISITYSECVSVALVIQHAMHMCRIILSSVACLAPSFNCNVFVNCNGAA